MSNKKKFSIFSFLICVLTTIFVFSLNKTFAETPEVSVTGKFADTIQNIKVSNNEGGNLDWDLEQWATFRIITSDSFEIRDINTNEIIAHATVDAENKKLTLTYTDYVEKHSDTNGSFFFYARVDFKKHPQQGEIPIEGT